MNELKENHGYQMHLAGIFPRFGNPEPSGFPCHAMSAWNAAAFCDLFLSSGRKTAKPLFCPDTSREAWQKKPTLASYIRRVSCRISGLVKICVRVRDKIPGTSGSKHDIVEQIVTRLSFEPGIAAVSGSVCQS
jgi:hypothetical protein